MPRKGQLSKFRGMTYEEIYGAEKTKELKEKRRINMLRRWRDEDYSEKTRIKMSEAGKKRIGEKNNFYGKEHTKESKEKMTQSKLGKPTWNKGLSGIYSKELRYAMSLRAQRRTGDKNPNWRGGETIKYANWRRVIFERDNYTCQKCLARNGFGKTVYLQAHHIIRAILAPEEKYEVSNGATLCKSCHMFIHRMELRDGFNEI